MLESWSLRASDADAGRRHRSVALVLGVVVLLTGCSGLPEAPLQAELAVDETGSGLDYRIGPGDNLEVFVWQDRELSASVPVRPDGRISLPLVEDMVAAGKTPTELARELERGLAAYVQSPVVTVIVTDFVGPLPKQVRVVGEAVEPQSLAYRNNMTVLDAVIAVGGLTEFAAGNRATLVRSVDGEALRYRVRLDDLVRDGDVTANAALLPGDVLIIPETFF